jgi:hypothetical protein
MLGYINDKVWEITSPRRSFPIGLANFSHTRLIFGKLYPKRPSEHAHGFSRFILPLSSAGLPLNLVCPNPKSHFAYSRRNITWGLELRYNIKYKNVPETGFIKTKRTLSTSRHRICTSKIIRDMKRGTGERERAHP